MKQKVSIQRTTKCGKGRKFIGSKIKNEEETNRKYLIGSGHMVHLVWVRRNKEISLQPRVDSVFGDWLTGYIFSGHVEQGKVIKNKDVKELNINQTGLIGTYKAVYSKFAQYSLFSNACDMFTKIDVYIHKANLNTF